LCHFGPPCIAAERIVYLRSAAAAAADAFSAGSLMRTEVAVMTSSQTCSLPPHSHDDLQSSAVILVSYSISIHQALRSRNTDRIRLLFFFVAANCQSAGVEVLNLLTGLYCTQSSAVARMGRPYRLYLKASVWLPVAERKRFPRATTIWLTWVTVGVGDWLQAATLHSKLQPKRCR